MEDVSIGIANKTVLILNDRNPLDSIKDKIAALGYTFQDKELVAEDLDLLDFDKARRELNRSGNLLAVLIFLSKSSLFNISNLGFGEKWLNVLAEVKKTPSLIFIHEDNFRERFFDLDAIKLCSETQHLIQKVMDDLKNKQQEIKLSNIDFKKINTNAGNLAHFLNELNALPNNSDLKVLANDILNISLTIDGYVQLFERFTEVSTLERFNKRNFDKLENLLRDIETVSKNYMPDFVQCKQIARQYLDTIQKSGIEIVPYKTKSDMSIRVHHFLDEIDRGVFLHLYVPNGRYQEDQLNSFLRLFESYLQRIEKLPFFIDVRKTLHGKLYEFKSKNLSVNLPDMEVAFARFENFMNLCQNDLKNAETLLLRTGINQSETTDLLTKYLKEYKRLLLDIEHERETKMLKLRQRLESEAFERVNTISLIEPQTVQPIALLSPSKNFDPISISISNSSVNINSGLQAFIEQEMNGDIRYTTEDKELIHFFEQYAERLESIRLRSELEQLKDTSLPETERKNALQKIVGFLFNKVAPAVGQSALTVLTAYLQKILTGL